MKTKKRKRSEAALKQIQEADLALAQFEKEYFARQKYMDRISRRWQGKPEEPKVVDETVQKMGVPKPLEIDDSVRIYIDTMEVIFDELRLLEESF